MKHCLRRYRWDELALDKVTDMVACKVIATNHGTVTQAYYKKGTIVPCREGQRDLIVYVLEGALRIQVAHAGSETLRQGDVLVVPAGAEHEAETLDDTFVMTFS
jgi:quercetin dioxygenase-like cupin family protein